MPDVPPIRSITVATDLQSDSRRLLRVAAEIGRTTGAGVHLVHAIETDAPRWVGRDAREARLAELRQEAEQALEVQTSELEDLGGEVESVLTMTEGPTHAALLEHLETAGSDLLVAGSHAREGRGHRLGSTVDRLLRTSPVPVLVVRGELHLPFRRVAVLTDFSSSSTKGLRLAAAWLPALAGDDPEARLDVLHIGDALYHRLEPDLERRLRENLDEAVASVREEVSSAVGEPRLVWGVHPVDEIERAAAEHDYDLLVLSTHGHGPIRRALIGSVAMGLAQGSPRPVLVVPSD